ncbi:MAG: protein kinase [Bdellovibrionales bacterium]|nr:protein kinase [Bdellovibrionales bacterium]
MPYKNQSLFAKGLEYEILYCFKQDKHKQVFKALRKETSTGLKQEVLVKIFLDSRFQEEFESLSKVISPYCVRLFGFENFGKKQALILEYINGVSLFQLLKQFSLKEKESSYILNCIYKGLKALKSYGISHGDLSLDNVLIDEKAQIKLIDFGRGNYEKESFFTVPFVAPEILKGFQPNFLSDLYSLGVLSILLKENSFLKDLQNLPLTRLEKTHSLLSLDPLKRVFSEKTTDSKSLKSLSFKVKELLSELDSKRCQTMKQKPATSFHVKMWIRFVFIGLIVLCSTGSYPYKQTYGLLKIYTHKWFLIESSDVKSYTPLNLLLEEGWHQIKWKSHTSEGEKKIFISSKKKLILNDTFFQIKK